ncbi:Os09g0297200 [Oryza sativa Japonica Group]|uniref:Os09g0297200 protein n=1 Tax=Oryza sativa subsp. japonica TaxID=39947 RepID=A0A0P0XL06_ORYSJ|nr:hypothetical protein EE612_046716 [Oryza sativa]BAT07320.1 Os09g0297200 [Oryza sativa Japonica Group]
MSSMGTPLVSGTKSATKAVMAATHPAKKKKSTNLRRQSSGRKACATANVMAMFTATVMLCPAGLTSSGITSLGTSHANGPHDHANAATYTHMAATTAAAYPAGIAAVPDHPSLAPISAPTAAWLATICAPPSRNSARRPTRSTASTDTSVAAMFTPPVITADISDAPPPNPSVLNSTGA